MKSRGVLWNRQRLPCGPFNPLSVSQLACRLRGNGRSAPTLQGSLWARSTSAGAQAAESTSSSSAPLSADNSPLDASDGEDTIAAIVSGGPNCSVGIVRVSGPKAVSILKSMFVRTSRGGDLRDGGLSPAARDATAMAPALLPATGVVSVI